MNTEGLVVGPRLREICTCCDGRGEHFRPCRYEGEKCERCDGNGRVMTPLCRDIVTLVNSLNEEVKSNV